MPDSQISFVEIQKRNALSKKEQHKTFEKFEPIKYFWALIARLSQSFSCNLTLNYIVIFSIYLYSIVHGNKNGPESPNNLLIILRAWYFLEQMLTK